MLLENYTGDSKVLKAIAHILNRKAPLPLDGDGDADFGTNGQVLTTDGDGNTYWSEGGGGGSGHTIEDADGTDLTQRNTLQFAGYLKADDDSVNSKTVVDDSPTEVTWATWQTMTDAQKAGTKWLITGAPDTDVDASDVTYGSDTVGGILDGRRVRHNITTRLTNLSQAVSEQNLEKYGYTIGDYFTGASGYEYILADLDTFYGGYDSYVVLSTHHIGIVVNTKNSGRVWDNSGSIPGNGYSDSTLHTFLTGSCLVNIKSDLTALFGDWSSHLLAHTIISNKVSGWVVVSDVVISALSECQVYGSPIFSGDAYQQGEADQRLAVFRKYKYWEIFGQYTAWLRCIANSSEACCANKDGYSAKNRTNVQNLAVGLILFK